MFWLETEKAKQLGVQYEVRTGAGMTTINVYKDGEAIDCFTINKNVTADEALAHIEEWEAYSEEAYNE